MSEPDISTLARRLAEQNNVDWRALRGSGPEGKVVERDVLDFLARVMAGEEAVNPTPEPVPEGMEAWPEQDIQGFRAGVGEAATLGELRDELGHASREYLSGTDPDREDEHVDASVASTGGYGFAADDARPATYSTSTGVSQQAVEPAAQAAVEAGVEADTGDTIDEDIFLFEDDDGESVDAPALIEPVAAQASDDVPASDDLDELLVAGDDYDGATVDIAEDVDAYTTSAGDGRFGGVSTGYLGGDTTGDDYAEPDVGGVATGHADVSGFGSDAASVAETDTATASGAVWGEDISFGGPGGAAAGRDDDVPDLWGPADAGNQADTDLWTGTGNDREVFSTASTEVPVGAEAEDDALPAFHVDAAGADDVPEPLEAEPAAAVFEHVDTETSTAGVEAGLAAVGATVLSAGTATLPLARPGTILRRNIDVSALAAAQLAVGQELGYDEPLAASAFLLRAVAKAVDGAGFGPGAVGLAVLEDGVVIKRVDDAATSSFTALVRALTAGGPEEDEPVLVAADLSGLDVDEAVLDLDVPVISLGRILYDNQRGAYRSTLSLTGPMPLGTAADLLVRVAELLDAPVRLVL